MLSPQWSLSCSCTIAPWSPLSVWHGGGRLCLVSNRCNRQSHLLSPVQYSRCGILLCCRCHRRLHPLLLFLIMTIMNHHCHIVVLTACANSCAIAVAVAASATLELPLRLNARQIVTFVVRAFLIETRGLRSGFVQSCAIYTIFLQPESSNFWNCLQTARPLCVNQETLRIFPLSGNTP